MKLGKLKKKNLIIGISAILLIVILIVGAILLFGGNKESQEEKLTKSLQEMGIDFYENYYYPQIGSTDDEKKEFVKKYESIGIKINLDNLSRFNTSKNEEKVKEFVNEKTNKECDKTNTRVIIYPKSPYDKDSYDIEIELVCGFEENK